MDQQTNSSSTTNTLENCTLAETLNDESFVGVHFLNGKFDFRFPLGFNYVKRPDTSDEKQMKDFYLKSRKDILVLLSVLRNFQTKEIAHKESSDKIENSETNFPIFAYMFVYDYYKKNGYYVPKENIYKVTNSGKVNWNRTVKQTKPIVSNNNIVYLETVRNKINYNENELIAIINRYCVYESFLKIGCLFSSKMVKKENLKISKKACIKVLNDKYNNTFNSDEINLFKNMKKILEAESNDSINQEFYFGTTSFHTIWEGMVNYFFGENKKIREEYNPKLRWFDSSGSKISGQASTLRPDTIAFKYSEETKKVFILDSKYYKGSVNLDDGNLPLSESVPKQLVYANWAINKVNPKNESQNVFNAFIMPDNLEGENKPERLKMKYYGFVKPEWLSDEEFKDEKKPYNRIQGIKIDTRDLMENYFQRNKKDFDGLLEIIENEANSMDKYN